MTYGVHPMSHEAKTATRTADVIRRGIPMLLATLVAAVLTACSSGSGGTDVTIGSGQSADPVTLDFPVFYVKRPEILKRAFSLVPEYLVTREQDSVVNYMDYGVQLGRRFRALKLWMVIRAYGVDGLVARLREHREIAQKLAGWIESTTDWELAAPVPFSLVCFRYSPRGVSAAEQDRLNEAIMHAVNASGEMFISHTKLAGRFTLRLSIGNIRTGEGQVAAAWDRLQAAAKLSS